MATAPYSRRLNLTRDQLAQFLTDQQQIRQFELLFATVDAIAPDVVLEINIAAGTAQATANDALGQISALAQEVAVSDAVTDVKATQALDQIAMLAQETSVSIASAENKANQALALLGQLATAVEGLQMAPPPREFKRARYGQFYDTTTQVAGAINTPQAITFNTTDVTRGVFLGTPSSRVTVDTEGVYNFLFSIQLDKTSGGTGIFWVWPRINGVDVPDSNSQVQIQGNNAEQLVTVGYFFELKANDYVEIMFAVNDITVQVDSFPASAFYPAIPSIILTVSNNIQGVQ
jgi:hypothetical protein